MSREGNAVAVEHRMANAFPPSTRYRVLATIASGEVATVYVGSLCGPGGFERRVAIKRTHPSLLNEVTSRLMVDEARLASRIHHPNVVGVRDVEELEGELLLIMDYVEGVSLARLLDGGALPARIAGRVLLDAATGLSAIHALAESGEVRDDFVHRNVSPSNILVGTDGTSRLSDFGIARAALAAAAPEAALSLGRGGPAYLAPEYLDSGVATPLLDVFALGVVAWETLTSRRLFRAMTDTETTERIRGGGIPAPSEYATGLTPEVDAVILRALARTPAERCTARELVSGLEAALHHAGLLASRREVEEVVFQRCAESIQDRRRRIRSAVHSPPDGVPSASLVPPSGRFPIEPRTRPERRSGSGFVAEHPKLRARETVAKADSSTLGWKISSAVAVAAVALAALFMGSSGSSGVALAPTDARPASTTMAVVAAPPSIPTSASIEAVVEPHPIAPAPSLARPARSAGLPVANRPAMVAPPPAVDCETLYERAELRRAAGDLTGASPLYRAALDQNPRYLPARVALADLDWEQGRTDRARAAYGRLTEQFAPDLLPPRVSARAKAADGNEP